MKQIILIQCKTAESQIESLRTRSHFKILTIANLVVYLQDFLLLIVRFYFIKSLFQMGCNNSKVAVYSGDKVALEVAKSTADLLSSDESMHEQHDNFEIKPNNEPQSDTQNVSPRDGGPAPKLNAPPPRLSMRDKSMSFGTIDVQGDSSKNKFSSSRKLDISS